MWRIQIFLPSTPFMGVRISWETVARNCTGSQGAEMCIVVSLWNRNICGKRLPDLEAVFLHDTRLSTYNCWKCVKIYLRFGNRSFICPVFQLLEHPTILLHLVDTVSWCMQHVSNQEPNHKNTYSCWYGCPGRKCIFIVPVQGTTAWNLSLSLFMMTWVASDNHKIKNLSLQKKATE